MVLSDWRRKFLNLIAGGVLALGMSSAADAQEDIACSLSSSEDIRITLDSSRYQNARYFAVRNRIDEDGSYLELNAQDQSTYDIGFGLHRMEGISQSAQGLLHNRSSLSHREVDRVKLSIDNAWGIAMNTIGEKTGMDEHAGGRFGIALATALGMGATSRWAHEEAGHGLSAAGYGVQQNQGQVRYVDDLQGIPYSQVVDRWAGGLNNSEHLFFMYHRAALEDRLDLVDALGMFMSKLDAMIQWSYSTHNSHPGREWVNSYVAALQQSRSEGLQIDDDVDFHRIGILGRGDTRDYVTLLSMIHRNASHEKDLYATMLSAALSANFWQSSAFIINYIVNGKKSEELWDVQAGPVHLGLPSVAIYRLADGYYGEARSFIKYNDLTFSVEAGMGLGFLGGDVQGYTLGAGLHKLGIPFLPQVSMSLTGFTHMDGSVVKGYGGSAELRVKLIDSLEAYGRVDYSNNAITQRPGLGDEDVFFSFGFRVTLN